MDSTSSPRESGKTAQTTTPPPPTVDAIRALMIKVCVLLEDLSGKDRREAVIYISNVLLTYTEHDQHGSTLSSNEGEETMSNDKNGENKVMSVEGGLWKRDVLLDRVKKEEPAAGLSIDNK